MFIIRVTFLLVTGVDGKLLFLLVIPSHKVQSSSAVSV